MKKLIYFCLFTFAFSLVSFAQTPAAFKYQAVARQANGAIIPNQAVSFRISIIQNNTSGAVVYSETHQPTTNKMGLVTLEIGKGTTITGNMQTIDWGNDVFFLQVELDPSGGVNYILSGFSQLLPVPYAIYAENVRNKDDADADSINELQQLKLAAYELSIEKGSLFPLLAASKISSLVGEISMAFTYWKSVIGISLLKSRVPLRS